MKEFIKSFFAFGIAITFEKIIAFLLIPIYTRYFNLTEFGIIDLIFVTIALASIFAELQLETALQRYYYDFTGLSKLRFTSTIFILIISISFLLTFLIIIFSNQISFLLFSDYKYHNLVAIASILIPFNNFSMLSLILLRFEKKNKQFVIVVLAKVILMLLTIIIFVVYLKIGILGVFIAHLAANIFSSLILFFLIKDFIIYKISKNFIKISFSYAFPQIPARIGSAFLANGNRFFMISYLSVVSIGLFSLSLKLASVIQLLNIAFITAWNPFMFEQFKIKNNKQVFVNFLPLVACLVYLIVITISLFSKEIVSIIAHKQFSESYKYVGALCLYFSIYIFKEIVDIGPKFTEKTKYLSYSFLISLLVNFISLFFLIKYFDLKGVVLSMIISNIVLLILSWYFSNKLYYIPHNIMNFLFLSAPAFVISIGIMYVEMDIIERFLIFIFISLFYFYFFISSYKKNIESLDNNNLSIN